MNAALISIVIVGSIITFHCHCGLIIYPLLIIGRGTASLSLWAHSWNIEAPISPENKRGETDCQLSVKDQLIGSSPAVLYQRSAEGRLPCA